MIKSKLEDKKGLKQGKVKYLVIAYLTAFISGFCVMVVEIIAGRLIARYLGVSLYTWTSVIGVVLAGISFGNYVGGKIADRFQGERALSVLFILSSLSCAIVPSLNNLMGNFPLLFHLSWPVRIIIHVGLIFFLPSCILGMISPVVTKFALDQGFRTGRTIGNVYAFNVGGSILGTFITGFFLIAHLGSISVVWTVAGVLGVIGLLYGRSFFSYSWIVILIFLIFVSFSPLSWTKMVAGRLFLVEPDKDEVIYEKDSQYSYIRIVKGLQPGVYEFMLDGLSHSRMSLKEPTNPEYIYRYHRTYVDILKNLTFRKEKVSVLILGGGGYVFPRYVKELFPKSHIEVVEIDPQVTKAAIKAFGFSPENIKIHHLDARNYVEDLARRKKDGEKIEGFDFIFGDVVFGLAVPYQLTTYEYDEKISQLLKPNGLYVVTLVDSDKSSQFLNAMLNTLNKVFPYTYVIVPGRKQVFESGYETFVVVSSLRKIDKKKFEFASREFGGKLLNRDDLETIKKNSKDIVLTDDFAPVGNLLKDVFCMQGERMVCRRIVDLGRKFIMQGKLEEAIGQFQKVLHIDPNFVEAYNDIGSLKGWQGKYDEAIDYYKKALSIEPEFKPALIGLGSAYERKGNIEEAKKIYSKVLKIYPETASVYVSLGNVLFKEGKLDEAIVNYRKALELEPDFEVARKNLDIAIKLLERENNE